MNAIIKNRMLVLLAAISLLAASCSTEDDNFVPNLPQETQTDLIGNLLDLGPVSDSSRVMVLTLEKHGNLYSLAENNAIGSGELIKLYMFTDADGHLPAGTYSFTEDESSLPFTIREGEVLAKFNNSDKSNELLLVSGGSVTVTYNGTLYSVDFTLNLNPDHYIEGTAYGKIAYADL